MLDTELARLGSILDGALIRPDDADYDEVRAVWNGMIDRRPGAIARCANINDVMAAVDFAREHGLLVSVRGGGHHIAGTAVCDDGLMIDLSAMRAVSVDPDRRTALVEGGATLGDLDRETQAFGLATPGGVVSTTGVGGLTLGAGFGWLSRLHGLAIDNLVAAELVTADGRQVEASEDENPELFWGLRGGGGNFGVVTSFTFRLHEVGPEVLFGPTVYRLDDAANVLRGYRAFAATAPRECCVWADLITAPPLPFLPEQYHGTGVLTLMQCYAGDPNEGETVLAPLHEHAEAIGSAVMPRPYVEAQQLLDGVYEKGARNYWTSRNFAGLDDPAPEMLVDLARTLPTPQSDILICQFGGAIADVAPEATAYPHRQAAFAVAPGARWTDPSDDAASVDWVRGVTAKLSSGGGEGCYVNSFSESEGRARDAYGANFERLAALKACVDPDNLFRLNQNIRPAETLAQ